MLTVCVSMFGVLLPPHSSWVCQRQWSPADTHTDRSPLCWCTLHFYTATSDCSVLSTRSRLWTEKERNDIKTDILQGYTVCFSLLYFAHTNAGHAGQVQSVSIKAVTGVTLLNPDTPAILTAIEYPTLLCLQTLKCLEWICRIRRQQSASLSNQQVTLGKKEQPQHQEVAGVLKTVESCCSSVFLSPVSVSLDWGPASHSNMLLLWLSQGGSKCLHKYCCC